MREACGSPCSALKRPFGSDRLVAFGDDAGGLRAPRTPRGHKTLPSAPSVRRRVPGRRPGLWRAQRAKAAVPADAAAHLGGAARTPTGTRDNPSVRLDASRLPLLRTETSLWDVPVFRSAYWRKKPHRGFLRQTLDLQPLCGLRQCGKPAASLAPHGNVPLGRSSVSIGLLAKKAPQGLSSSNARSPAALRPPTMREACGFPCSARKRPFGTFQCFDRLIGEKSPTGAFFVKRSISSRFAASDNAGSLRLPLLRTETSLWDVPVFRSAYWRKKPHRGFLRQTLDLQPLCGLRQCGKPAASLAPHGNVPLGRSSVSIGLLAKKPHRGFLRQTLDLQPPCGLRQCGKPAAPLTGAPKEKRDSLQKRESRGENRIS